MFTRLTFFLSIDKTHEKTCFLSIEKSLKAYTRDWHFLSTIKCQSRVYLLSIEKMSVSFEPRPTKSSNIAMFTRLTCFRSIETTRDWHVSIDRKNHSKHTQKTDVFLLIENHSKHIHETNMFLSIGKTIQSIHTRLTFFLSIVKIIQSIHTRLTCFYR